MSDADRDARRKPVICAVSISRLKRLFCDIAPAYAGSAEIQIVEKGFDAAVQELRSRIRSDPVAVLVAAGSNGAYLRQHMALPVVLVKVSGFDALEALAKARRVSERVAIVSHETISAELEQFKQLYGLPIEQRAYRTAEEARACVRELAAAGIEAIVGPGLVTDVAEEAGLTGVFLYSVNSVREAFDHAIEIARIARIEEARRERLSTILRHLNEGVAAVDMDGRVQSLNPAMERLLGIDAERAVGRALSGIAPELGLAPTLQRGATELGGIQRVAGRTIVTNRIPILDQGVQTGAVLTFQDSEAIERADRNLRSRNRSRHFVARYRLEQLLGEAPAMRQVRALAERYAKSNATILVTGESGTGKEVLAQGIHNAGPRKGRRFVAINCAAFPETLLESELFGHEEGAFTGSRRGGKTGLFEAAHTGTIFLDEIGETPLGMQTRLLRVLQEREVLRLGASEPTPIDVRVIAATNRDLAEQVARGEFRSDLFYRLNILRIALPPLRSRGEDLAALCTTLLDKALRSVGGVHAFDVLAEELLPHLRAYSWPGNVRELENVIERVAVYVSECASVGRLELDEIRRIVPEIFGNGGEDRVNGEQPALRSASRRAELDHIVKTLEACLGNQQEACRRLGIGRTTLWRRLRQSTGA